MLAFEADNTAMQALAETLINPAGGGEVVYKVLLSTAMVSFIDIARCSSAVDVVGWLPGRECAFWVPLLESHPNDPTLDRFVFWAPYIFINYTIGLVVGRQTWGWPKVLADITVASDNPAAPVFDCATTYFPTLSADHAGGRPRSLFKITGLSADRPAPGGMADGRAGLRPPWPRPSSKVWPRPSWTISATCRRSLAWR